MGGTVVIAGPSGRRELPAEVFLTGMLSNALEPGEMVVELRYPRQPAGTGTAFVEFARRLGDFAIAGAAAMLTVHDGICERARLTIVGMGEGPFRARAAEEMLIGSRLEGKILREAIASIVEAVEPAEDVHASSSYRRHLAGVMADQALTTALSRAGGH
jgi:carbon-monoxide dehydrogenase medium subunit